MPIPKANVESSHDQPRPQAARADELTMPHGIKAPADTASEGNFTGTGKFAKGNDLATKGAEARWQKERLRRQLAERLGLPEVGEDFEECLAQARGYEADLWDELKELAGEQWPIIKHSTIVGGDIRMAALAYGAALYLYSLATKTGDTKQFGEARQQSVASRGTKQTAIDLAGKLLALHREAHPADVHKAVVDAFGKESTDS